MDKTKKVNRKGSRQTTRRVSRPIKRRRPTNQYEIESDKATTSSSARKLKFSQAEVPINAMHGYRIINFLFVFNNLSEMLKCKICNGNASFAESSIRGLGFKLVINCENCPPRYINSCPLIKNAYEINRRLVFAMRLLGIGYNGIRKFCGIMDLSKMFAKKVYDDIVENIYCASKSIASTLFSEAAREEKELTTQIENIPEPAGLTVSGDGTWHTRGFSSLHGVVSLIGLHSAKILDVAVKSSYCKECEHWKQKYDTADFDTWMESHKEVCSSNHAGSSGKMEVGGMIEMFARSEQLHGVKYLSYIGDGDCKTYKGVVESQPYGDGIQINKKECVGHVQKRMGARLRRMTKETRGLGGKGKLTGKLIDELSVYYGLAIRRHKNSKQEMRKAIWATLKHKASTDAEPQHENCPPGPDSWCTWQVAKATNQLGSYTHKPALHKNVIEAITPIYEELNREDLLERCLGGYTQNSNESLNALIWSIAPKRTYVGAKIINIAAYIASSIFNAGYSSVLSIMNVMNITIGPTIASACEELDDKRIATAEARTFKASEEERLAKRLRKSNEDDDQDPYYEAGMED